MRQARPPCADDRANIDQAIAAFARALSLEEGHPAPALQASHVREEGFGANARFRALLAEHAGRRVGYALFYRAYATEHGECGLYLQDLYIVPEARRQGTGRALMTAVARACQADSGCYVFWNLLPCAWRAQGAHGHAQPAAGRAGPPRADDRGDAVSVYQVMWARPP